MAILAADSDSDDGLDNVEAWTTADKVKSRQLPVGTQQTDLQASSELPSEDPSGDQSAPEQASRDGSDAGDESVSEKDELALDTDEEKPVAGGSTSANAFTPINDQKAGRIDVNILVPEVERDEISDFADFTQLARVVKEIMSHRESRSSGSTYEALFGDTRIERLSHKELLKLQGGKEAIEAYEAGHRPSYRDDNTASSSEFMSLSRPHAKRKRDGYADLDAMDAAIEAGELAANERKRPRLCLSHRRNLDSDDQLSEVVRPRRSTRSSGIQNTRSMRSTRRTSLVASRDAAESASESSADEIGFMTSDIKPKRPSRSTGISKRRSYTSQDGIGYDRPPRPKSTRQSGRATRHQGGMEEIGEDKIQRSDSDNDKPAQAPKVVGVKERFQALPRTDPFRNRHMQQCDSCRQGMNFAPLIYCQGCTFAYHKSCIGQRATREHLVTKVDHEDFVLQCRRCIGFVLRKESTAPDQAKCLDCKFAGPACAPFRSRKTTLQEQKDRELNDGTDPIVDVPKRLINNPANVMFRCVGCYRASHLEHLPPQSSDLMDMETDLNSVAAQRFAEYSRSWQCQECESAPAKVKGIIAWKPVDEDNWDPTKSLEQISEDDKTYLIRWEALSYFRASWMPGPWVWGVTAGAMRKAFARRDDAQVPKMRTEDAIPEEFLRTDIVLDVKYTSIVDVKGEEIDKARIREVKEALIKFKGLGYEDAVWERSPVPEDQDRWTDFVIAYNDFVMGRYVHPPKAQPLKTRLEKVRSKDFAKELEKKKQPELLVGGELMKYQLEGVNWLYYKWYSQQNAVLADEMGLGKTIQIIGLMATLVSEHNTYPFLVVVPNSTCANWRREIKHWAPNLRVVAWFGSAAAREMAYRYELYPGGTKDLAAHVVVTSYDAAQDDSAKKFLRSVPWQALIVDEGQRLKSDKTNLYTALTQLRVPFRILLTGTPLQNNARELFNLLHFLDDTHDAAQLETEFEDLDNEKVTRLHDMIRPFFLRRTKAQVLTFLPPMAQIIVPVSMTLVQKKLYRSILAKNPELLRALFGQKRDLKGAERYSLNNILMQLRKCLCHPFVYNNSIEERNVSTTISHRNLVEASGKLELLEVLLPKLKERGHRVLLFSQFLDMLTMVEDFLDGLGLAYHRLDGSMSSLQKQRRIDEFNAPDSEYFAFLLSTRAGGVGINLATADTVIILDPDFNPHQDIQALSRAHRIGQKKKVLCFQLVTRASAEEKIVQVGRKKMALDHVLIDQMDAEDASEQDLTSILLHGSSELFNDDGEKDIKYDAAEIDRLLDRSQIEDTKAGEDKSAESQFSRARVWAGSGLEDSIGGIEAEEQAPDPGVWDKILRERERVAAAEAAAARETLGRGRRAKQNLDYGLDPKSATADDPTAEPEDAEADVVPFGKPQKDDNSDDTDFQADSDGESSKNNSEDEHGAINSRELEEHVPRQKSKKAAANGQGKGSPLLTTEPGENRSVATCAKKGPATSPEDKEKGTPKKTGSRAKKQPPTKSPKTPEKRKRAFESSLPTPPNEPSQHSGGSVIDGAAPASASKKKKKKKHGPGGKPQPQPQLADMSNRGAAEVVDLTCSSFHRVNVPQLPGRSFVSLPTPPAGDDAYVAASQHGRPAGPGGRLQPLSVPMMVQCLACQNVHAQGSCPLKKAGVEYCNLCGMAHFGHARICPHINSETQVRAMLDALKQSPEAGVLVKEAARYLRGVKGTLVQKKKLEEEKRRAEAVMAAGAAVGAAQMPGKGLLQRANHGNTAGGSSVVDEDSPLLEPGGYGGRPGVVPQEGGYVGWMGHPAVGR